MKRFIISFLFLFTTTLFSQVGSSAIVLSQLFIGMEGVQTNEIVTHNIEAIGYVWTKSGSTFPITYESEVYNNSATSSGNASTSPLYNCADFNWLWLGGGEKFALGVYKITNSKDNSQFFYLDARDNGWPESGILPDLYYFIYDNGADNIYKFRGNDNFDISKGQVLRPSGILGKTYKTDLLQNFWSNALILTKNGSNKVKLIWGKHPSFTATHYKVYRALSDFPNSKPFLLNFSLLYTASSSTFDINDPDITIGGSTNKYAFYKVLAYNSNSGTYSSATNTVSVHGNYAPMKQAFDEHSEIVIDEYSLSQNYPNPFNPTTQISYSIKKDGFVSLKIYDLLGKEVSTLVSSEQETGSYTIAFNATKLSSGIYIARLVSNNYSKNIKMVLAK